MQGAEQRGFAGLLALVGTEGGIEHGSYRQGEQYDEAQDGEADARLLRRSLGISPLIGRRVGHGGRRAVDDFDIAAMPRPTRRRFHHEVTAGAARELGEDVFRQSFAGFGVGAGVGGTRPAVIGDAPGEEAGDGLAQRVIGINDLRQPYPQGDQRRKQALGEGHLLLA